MPSASGVYSLPPGYLAVTGTTIEASQHNPPLEDIAQALTNRLSRDGTAPMTGGLKAIPGTAALPGYVFSTDTSSGILKTTNGVGISVAGTQVAEFTSAGLASGVWLPGMCIPWTLSTVPNALWVFPVGQTLARLTYPTLWALAQVEIAAGNTFFNNGNGSTTFGIGDLRGRVLGNIDNMGGTDAGRLTGSAITAVRSTIGGAGGEGTHALPVAEVPNITSRNLGQSFTLGTSVPSIPIGNTVNFNQFSVSGTGANNFPYSAGGLGWGTFSGWSQSIQVDSLNTGGTSPTHNNVQPTMLLKTIMFAGN